MKTTPLDATDWTGDRLQDEYERRCGDEYDSEAGLDVTVFGVPANIVGLLSGSIRPVVCWSVAVFRAVDVDDDEPADDARACMDVARRLARPYADPLQVDAWLAREAVRSGLQGALL